MSSATQSHRQIEEVSALSNFLKIVVAVLSSALSLCALAQGMGGYTAQAIIDGNAGRNASGVLGVNMASGDSSLQSNATAIAIADPNGLAATQSGVVQAIDSGQFSVPDVAVTKIEGNSFSNASGALGINQSAGAANAQANSLVIGYGSEVTMDTELAQSVSGISLPVAVSGQIRETTIADTAFNETRGIVQVNQAAGIANATGNSFALRIQTGTP